MQQSSQLTCIVPCPRACHVHHQGSPVCLHSVRLLVGTAAALRIVALRESRVEAQPLLDSQPQIVLDIDCTPASSSSTSSSALDSTETAACKQQEGVQLAQYLQAVNAGVYAVKWCIMELPDNIYDTHELHQCRFCKRRCMYQQHSWSVLADVGRLLIKMQANLGFLSGGASCELCPSVSELVLPSLCCCPTPAY